MGTVDTVWWRRYYYYYDNKEIYIYVVAPGVWRPAGFVMEKEV
jgi:hypothetical protein